MDAPNAHADLGSAADQHGAVRWLIGGVEEQRHNTFLAFYAFALLITVAAIWLVAVAPEAPTTTSRAVLVILGANLLLIGGLAAVVGRRALLLFRRRTEAGARLHLRFVTLFSMVALVPAVLIALVFGVLVNRGVDQWFSDNVQSAVKNGAEIGRAYVADVGGSMQNDMGTIAVELGGIRDLFDNRIQFSEALKRLADFFGYPAIYILNGDGKVLASGEAPDAPPILPRPVLRSRSRLKVLRRRWRSLRTRTRFASSIPYRNTAMPFFMSYGR